MTGKYHVKGNEKSSTKREGDEGVGTKKVARGGKSRRAGVLKKKNNRKDQKNPEKVQH